MTGRVRRSRHSRAGDGRRISWSEVERVLLLRIAAGAYAVDQRLPTCEALAAELGVNKNTVSRAYRSLAGRGFVTSRPGAGVVLVRRTRSREPERALERAAGMIALAVEDARLAGLAEPEVRRLIEQALGEAYGGREPRIGFVECNLLDASTLARELEAALHQPVDPLLIDDLAADPDRHRRDYDILAVNITHLAAVEAALHQGPGSTTGPELFALHVPVDPASLTRIARLPAGTRLAVVCDLEQTLISLTGLVGGCNLELDVRSCLSQNRLRLRRLIRSSDVLLVTHSAEQRVRAEKPGIPVLLAAFRIDQRSIAELAAHLAEPRHAGATAAARVRLRAG